MEYKTALGFCLVLWLCVGSNADLADLQRLQSNVLNKNSLKFGDKCVYKTEQERQKQIREYMGLKVGLGIGAAFANALDTRKQGSQQGHLLAQGNAALANSLRAIESLPGYFCNSSQNLGCLSSETCGCAEADETMGFKISYERDGEACVPKGGSYCFGKEIVFDFEKNTPFRSTSSVLGAVTCADPDKCYVTNSTDPCTKANLASHKLEQNKDLGIGAAITEMFGGVLPGSCICAGTSILGSILLITTMAAVHFF